MATDLSLRRLRELLLLACGSCEAATEATWALLHTCHSADGQQLGDWWSRNAENTGKALGYSYKAEEQMSNAATLCEQDFPGDAKQLRDSRDALVQHLSSIQEFYDSAQQGISVPVCKMTQNDLWCRLYSRICAADTAVRSLLKSESIRVKQRPLEQREGEGAKRGRRGRKPADYEAQQREATLLAAWERAKEAGTYQPDFAKQNGLNVKDLITLLNRARKRIARARTR